jgi:hypothetical protein
LRLDALLDVADLFDSLREGLAPVIEAIREVVGSHLLQLALNILPKQQRVELALAIVPVARLWKLRAFNQLPVHLRERYRDLGGKP